MEQQIITGKTEEEIWQKINAQFLANPDPLEYSAVIEQGKRKVVLDIDIDLGGGFESGFESTTLTAALLTIPVFRFAIHEKHFTDEIGKFFGMEDVEIGFAEFDEKLIIKTNDRLRVKEIFSDELVRKIFESLSDFTFGITYHNRDNETNVPFLELYVEHGITDPIKLREIYHAFISVLMLLDTEVEITQ
ncbi:hypothetical protein [Segetibacter koreensis]|uniref:hypothetical protein n=1 Tax=Segetibacter koreensis TaxID=398037 RepID=UPI0003784EEB|nr:hypothetical protein [Segetibacter koreensis]